VQDGLRTEIIRIVLLALFLLLFGFVNGYPLLTLLLGGTAYLLYSFHHANRIYRWLGGENDTPPPEADGLWGDMSEHFYRMKRRLDQAQRNYTGLALRIRQITSALDDAMLLLNSDGTLDWWNPMATRLLQLRNDDRGENIVNLIRHPQFVGFINGRQFDHALELTSPVDANRILHFSAGLFGRGDIVLVVRDITRLRHLEEMRKEFVANISHELRTPLTVLVGYLETLQDSEDFPTQWRRAFQQMEQQTQRLGALAEDLVMLSQLESGQFTPRLQAVDISKLLHAIVDGQRMLCCDTHGISLDCPPGLTLSGDSRELESAFSNLIVNAIRHNPQGCQIQVRARRHRHTLVVTVADHGAGIDKQHLPRLTERFYRADHSRASHSGGTGLGLAIVKHVLGRHHGTLKIRSTLGRGSVFSCRFTLTGAIPSSKG